MVPAGRVPGGKELPPQSADVGLVKANDVWPARRGAIVEVAVKVSSALIHDAMSRQRSGHGDNKSPTDVSGRRPRGRTPIGQCGVGRGIESAYDGHRGRGDGRGTGYGVDDHEDGQGGHGDDKD